MNLGIKKGILSKISFTCALVLTLIIAVIFLYNIIQWGNLPDYGFGYRTAAGISVVGVVTEPGRIAGMEVGDHILEVNGQSFRTMREFRAAQNKGLQEKNSYIIDRNGKRIELTITNSTLRIKGAFSRSGLTYLIGLCYILIGILVFLMKPYQRTTWIFFVFGTAMGLLFMFFVKLGDLKPSWLGTIHILINTLVPAAVIHLAMGFPEERHFIRKFSHIQILPYLLSILLFLSIRLVTPHLVDAPRILYYFLIAYFVASIIFFLGSCFQLWIASQSEIVKLRSKMILLGAAVSALIPLFEISINTLFRSHIFPSFNYYLPFLIIFPLFVGYSIAKHNLFDIDAIIKRTYGYILTTGSIAGAYGFFVLMTNVVFGKLDIAKSPLFPLLFILGVIFLFNPIRNRVQKFIDRVFYRLEYDYQETVQRISESLRSLLSFDQIGNRMMETATQTMFMDSGCIHILKPDGDGYEPLRYIEKRDELGKPIPSSLYTTILPSNDPLIQKIADRKREVTFYDIQEDPFFEQNRESYKKAFNQLEATLIIPLVYEDTLTGLMSLGNKKSGKFYRREDINLLRILANQGAVAIQNAKLHQARIEALEQSKKELEQLNRAKSKALDHLSHELRTPLALIQGNIRILKRKTQTQTPPIVREEVFESLERNLTRLSDIQQETDRIIGSYQELEARQRPAESDRSQPLGLERIDLYPFAERILEHVKTRAKHRDLELHLDGQEDLNILMDPKILEELSLIHI